MTEPRTPRSLVEPRRFGRDPVSLAGTGRLDRLEAELVPRES